MDDGSKPIPVSSKMLAPLLLYLGFGSLASGIYALDNGVARTPPMGWNPYNAFVSVSCSTRQLLL